MARYTYVVLSQAQPGQDDEFRRWYVDQHLADVVKHPDVLSARLLVPDFQKTYDLNPPAYCLLTIYEIESDDPEGTVESIKALAGTEAMPMTDALNRSGMIQVVAHQIAAID